MGAFAAMSVAQGGSGCPIFAETVFAYFHTGKTTNLNIPMEDLPLPIKSLVEQVMLTTIVTGNVNNYSHC